MIAQLIWDCSELAYQSIIFRIKSYQWAKLKRWIPSKANNLFYVVKEKYSDVLEKKASKKYNTDTSPQMLIHEQTINEQVRDHDLKVHQGAHWLKLNMRSWIEGRFNKLQQWDSFNKTKMTTNNSMVTSTDCHLHNINDTRKSTDYRSVQIIQCVSHVNCTSCLKALAYLLELIMSTYSEMYIGAYTQLVLFLLYII